MNLAAADAVPVNAARPLPLRIDTAVRAWTLALGALGSLALALGYVLLVRSPIILTGDDAMYVILAKALATGQGYRFINLPGAPAATHFPPGYPALLAVLWRLAPAFPANLALFKWVNAIALAVVAVATARFARDIRMPPAVAIGLGAVAAMSGPLLILGNMLLSELFFLALLLLLLPALERFIDLPSASRRPALEAAALGLVIGTCLLFRTHGIVLVPATAFLLARRRRWRDAAILSGTTLACLLPWQLWSARHAGALPTPLLGQYDSYVGWWARGFQEIGAGMIPMTLGRTIPEAGGMLAVLFSPSRSALGHVSALIALAALAIAGIVAERRRLPVTMLFLAGYLAIVAVWPFPPARFIWGVWPVILILLAAGARRVAGELRRWSAATRMSRTLAVAGALAALWVATGYAAYELRMARGRWWTSIPRANAARIVPAVRWTIANTAPSDLLAAEDDGALYLYTGRQALPIRTFSVQQYLFPISAQAEAEQGLIPLLSTYPIRSIVVGSPTTFATVQWAAARPHPLVSFRDQFAGGAAFTVLPR